MTKKIKTDRTLLKGYAKTMEKFGSIPDGAGKSGGARLAVSNALGFLKKVGQITDNIQQARLKNFDDPTRTKEKQKLDTSKYANGKLSDVKHAFDNLDTPGVVALNIQERITQDKRKVAMSEWAREARDRIAQMDPKDRVKQVYRAIKSGDREFAAGILGAPSAMHSGLTPESYEKLNSAYNQRFHGADTKVIENLTKLDGAVHRARKEFGGFVRDLNRGLDETISKAKAAQEAMQQ